jgi:hypothetical protein
MKAKEIYEFADEHIHPMLIHDLRHVICVFDRKFFEQYSKPEELVLEQKLNEDMQKELVKVSKQRIDQAQYYKDNGYYYSYDEDRVQRAYVDIINYILLQM